MYNRAEWLGDRECKSSWGIKYFSITLMSFAPKLIAQHSKV